MNTELPPMPKSEAMSQAEVERLLVATAEQAAAGAMPPPGEGVPDQQSPPRHEFPANFDFLPVTFAHAARAA